MNTTKLRVIQLSYNGRSKSTELFLELFQNIKQFNPAKTGEKSVRNCMRKDGTNDDGWKK